MRVLENHAAAQVPSLALKTPGHFYSGNPGFRDIPVLAGKGHRVDDHELDQVVYVIVEGLHGQTGVVVELPAQAQFDVPGFLGQQIGVAAEAEQVGGIRRPEPGTHGRSQHQCIRGQVTVFDIPGADAAKTLKISIAHRQQQPVPVPVELILHVDSLVVPVTIEAGAEGKAFCMLPGQVNSSRQKLVVAECEAVVPVKCRTLGAQEVHAVILINVVAKLRQSDAAAPVFIRGETESQRQSLVAIVLADGLREKIQVLAGSAGLPEGKFQIQFSETGVALQARAVVVIAAIDITAGPHREAIGIKAAE